MNVVIIVIIFLANLSMRKVIFSNQLYSIILSHLFTVCSGKVLVTTGWPRSASGKCEVIDLEDSNNICQDLEDYPNQVSGTVGGLLNQVDPLVCGGNPTTNVCYVVNQPGQSSEMLE
jgi:hypothetical protein